MTLNRGSWQKEEWITGKKYDQWPGSCPLHLIKNQSIGLATADQSNMWHHVYHYITDAEIKLSLKMWSMWIESHYFINFFKCLPTRWNFNFNWCIYMYGVYPIHLHPATIWAYLFGGQVLGFCKVPGDHVNKLKWSWMDLCQVFPKSYFGAWFASRVFLPD